MARKWKLFFLKKRISNKTRRLRYCAAAGKKRRACGNESRGSPQKSKFSRYFLQPHFFAHGFLATDFKAQAFLAQAFFAGAFLAAAFLAGAFLAAAFFAGAFLTAAFFTAAFFAGAFLTAAFLAGAFLAAAFLAGAFFATAFFGAAFFTTFFVAMILFFLGCFHVNVAREFRELCSSDARSTEILAPVSGENSAALAPLKKNPNPAGSLKAAGATPDGVSSKNTPSKNGL